MDIYYRLNVFPIQLPPLREGKEDILFLAGRILVARQHQGTEKPHPPYCAPLYKENRHRILPAAPDFVRGNFVSGAGASLLTDAAGTKLVGRVAGDRNGL
jgi:hypothetical protein